MCIPDDDGMDRYIQITVIVKGVKFWVVCSFIFSHFQIFIYVLTLDFFKKKEKEEIFETTCNPR